MCTCVFSEENPDIESGKASSDTDAANTTVILKGTGKAYIQL